MQPALALDERALPRLGEVIDAKAEPDDDVLYSVTTLLGVLDKPALIPWAVGETAVRVVPNLDLIRRRLHEEGFDAAVDYVERLRWNTDGKLKDSELGTLAHHLFDVWATTGLRPPLEPELHPRHAVDGSVLGKEDLRALTGMLDNFDRGFLQAFCPEYIATEVVVYNQALRYAGQADGFVVIDGMRLILDYKTSRKTYTKDGKLRGPFPQVGLQLAAYRYATAAAVWRARRFKSYSRRYYLLSPTEREMALPVPEVDNGIAVYVTPESCTAYPVRCEASGDWERPGQFESFVYVREAARWLYDQADDVIGNPMVPRHVPEQDDPFKGLPREG